MPVAAAVPIAVPENPADRLSALFDRHYQRLYRLARRLTPGVDDALDLVQEVFLKAARSPGAIPDGAPAEEAWLVRVLINLRRDQWRKAAVRTRHASDVGQRSLVDDGQEAALIARTTVWRALDSVRPRRRAVLVMYELEGLPIPAIGSLLGISAITVRWHLSMGRRDLARALGPHRGGVSEQRQRNSSRG